jgi:hypothetical protein
MEKGWSMLALVLSDVDLETVQVDGVFTLRATDDDSGATVVLKLSEDGANNLRDELNAEGDSAVRDLLWTLEEEQQNRDYGKAT